MWSLWRPFFPSFHRSIFLLRIPPVPEIPATSSSPPTPCTTACGPWAPSCAPSFFPGWGQAATGRPMTGSVFVAWEGVTAMMTLKAQQEANYFKEIHSKNLRLKRQEVQDWLVLWVFNHLFSGAEAYVSAHLRDFPPDLNVRAFPGGIGISVPVHE